MTAGEWQRFKKWIWDDSAFRGLALAFWCFAWSLAALLCLLALVPPDGSRAAQFRAAQVFLVVGPVPLVGALVLVGSALAVNRGVLRARGLTVHGLSRREPEVDIAELNAELERKLEVGE